MNKVYIAERTLNMNIYISGPNGNEGDQPCIPDEYMQYAQSAI